MAPPQVGTEQSNACASVITKGNVNRCIRRRSALFSRTGFILSLDRRQPGPSQRRLAGRQQEPVRDDGTCRSEGGGGRIGGREDHFW